ncbi:arginine/ornithine succinyltransferase subunit alpha [Pseudogulbenkiania ferrooxidans]|uniref:Arginine/ornithine succinyltransferase, alpha subunit n=1 Tax=Pseudogulbenkiania ferrooxidans 2002 TaxID=279714 RepID=B9Z545_9NEIS|nr:arginine/ornithine succinyltransferase subunit alpha [Pseudogulbenkiania ferrooxidans]EEG08277.1 arginine/ornithine succinyltransferase, alpha subunit [Pseudogulbenkiania ferrooxidans 2002]
MLVVRPVRTSDLPAIERMAVASGIGVTSLPNDRDKLFERIQQSASAFEHEAVPDTGREFYMFVLEEHGEVVGTASISASAGFDEPFYSYRSETFVHASRPLKVNNRIHVLNICHDLTGMVQLCGFYADPAYRGLGSELLSRARLLFIAGQRERFGKRILAEMQGIHDEQGQSPFWNAIGRRFFNMDFIQVEQAFVSHSKTFIAELMPAYPIYVPLLPDEAQNAIGQVHPDFERPFMLLTSEGFEADNYLDIFDGGAVLTADVDRLWTVECSGTYPVEVSVSLPPSATTMLLSNGCTDRFAAVAARVALVNGMALMTQDVAQVLALSNGQPVRVVPLHEAKEKQS